MTGGQAIRKRSIKGKSVFERWALSIMDMDDATWERHASPWSVWTRFSCLPLLCLTIWSRVWLDQWFAIPVAFALLWTFLNPRIFKPPRDFNHWPAKATFGERVWLNRKMVPIPAHHERAALITSLLILPATLVMVYGLYELEIWPTVLGMALTMLGKVWFCDRMVWLYEDMRRENAVYASWLNRPVNDNGNRHAA
ncbi:MAG: DUF6653 family protein [Pseudomonadota bacterium]